MTLALTLFTVIGQIRSNGVSLESRYHVFVNSSQFQRGFWSLATPVTWTVEKTRGLIRFAQHRAEESNPAAR